MSRELEAKLLFLLQLFSLWENSSASTSLLVRPAKFEILPNCILDKQFELAHQSKITRSMCVMTCHNHQDCLSAAYKSLSQNCFLYSVDYRMLLNASLFLCGQANVNLYSLSSEEELSCYDGATKTAAKKCQLDKKNKINSICSDWTAWLYNYANSPCGNLSKFHGGRRHRYRNCTRPLNGGMDCSGNQYEVEDIELVNVGSTNTLTGAEKMCKDNGFEILSSLHDIPNGELIKNLSGDNEWTWTGLKEKSTNVYGDKAGLQWVHASCSHFWKNGQPGNDEQLCCDLDKNGMLYDAFCEYQFELKAVVCEKGVSVEVRSCNDPYFTVI